MGKGPKNEKYYKGIQKDLETALEKHKKGKDGEFTTKVI